MVTLDQIHSELGWPKSNEVFSPPGVTAGPLADLANRKLGDAIRRLRGGSGVQVGILAADREVTEAPLAIVCNFPTHVSDETLLETQRLAWNFGRSPLLVTIEPTIIRKWSCFQPPVDPVQPGTSTGVASEQPSSPSPEILPQITIDPANGQLSSAEAETLSWVELLSGNFFAVNSKSFPTDTRADRMLLSNLREVRDLLMAQGLDVKYSHDLLARAIFIQFLFDRKDTRGQAALNAGKLHELSDERILIGIHTTLSEILDSYDDAYSLFMWLNQRFNGDLFPGKGETQEQREVGWREEQAFVKPQHLQTLAEFVSGRLEMKSGQRSLWRLYAFDAIPLEVISTIYEEFVKGVEGVGVHYTPSHLADLMLDRVLPWQSENWNLRILDPACGSGIFLVKAYQRLVSSMEMGSSRFW